MLATVAVASVRPVRRPAARGRVRARRVRRRRPGSRWHGIARSRDPHACWSATGFAILAVQTRAVRRLRRGGRPARHARVGGPAASRRCAWTWAWVARRALLPARRAVVGAPGPAADPPGGRRGRRGRRAPRRRPAARRGPQGVRHRERVGAPDATARSRTRPGCTGSLASSPSRCWSRRPGASRGARRRSDSVARLARRPPGIPAGARDRAVPRVARRSSGRC